MLIWSVSQYLLLVLSHVRMKYFSLQLFCFSSLGFFNFFSIFSASVSLKTMFDPSGGAVLSCFPSWCLMHLDEGLGGKRWGGLGNNKMTASLLLGGNQPIDPHTHKKKRAAPSSNDAPWPPTPPDRETKRGQNWEKKTTSHLLGSSTLFSPVFTARCLNWGHAGPPSCFWRGGKKTDWAQRGWAKTWLRAVQWPFLTSQNVFARTYSYSTWIIMWHFGFLMESKWNLAGYGDKLKHIRANVFETFCCYSKKKKVHQFMSSNSSTNK